MKLAIFDLDGTLVDSLMLWDVFWREFGKRFLNGQAFEPTAEDRNRVKTRTLRGAMELIHDNYGVGKDVDELLETVQDIILTFYEKEVELKPGVMEFVEYCYQKQIPMCLASATERRVIELGLKHCQIDRYLPKIFSCVEVGKGKEEPDVFLAACEYYGVKANEAWVFEDSLVALKTAKKAGFQTVGVFDKHHDNWAQVKEVSKVFIDDGETMMKLIGEHV